MWLISKKINCTDYDYQDYLNSNVCYVCMHKNCKIKTESKRELQNEGNVEVIMINYDETFLHWNFVLASTSKIKKVNIMK